jgi:glutaryl-CoA dehydrogenase
MHKLATSSSLTRDFLCLDAFLAEEEVMVRDAIHDWVQEQVVPVVDDHFQKDHFHLPWKDELAELGVLGAGIEGYGGTYLSNVCRGLMYQELERGDSGLRSFASVTNSLVIYPIYTFGSEAQREAWLPELTSGRKVGCFALTEPDFGSNPGGMRTNAERVDGGWRLNGWKRWITNGSIADVAIVFAATPEGIRGFLVEKDRPGFQAPRIVEKWSLRASVTSEVILDDVIVPEENLLPGTDIGLKAALMCLTEARHGIAWGAIGAMLACYLEAHAYVMTRRQFGNRPLASHQLVQKRLSWMLTEISRVQALTLHIGRMKDRGLATHAHISMAKRSNCATALEIARTARDMLGASGITHEYTCGRHLLNLESVNTYEGAEDVHHLVLGQHITGIPAFEG